MLHAHCVKPKLVDQVAFMNNFIDPGAFDPAFHMPIVFSPLPLMAGCQAAHNVALANRNRADKPQSIQTTRSFQPDYTSPRVSAVGTIAKKFMLNADDIIPLNMDLGSYGPVIPGSMFTVVKDLGNIKRDICTVPIGVRTHRARWQMNGLVKLQALPLIMVPLLLTSSNQV